MNTCETCEFRRPAGQPGASQCQRYPPHAQMLVAQGPLGQQQIQVQAFYPPVLVTHGCGEWKMKEEVN